MLDAALAVVGLADDFRTNGDLADYTTRAADMPAEQQAAAPERHFQVERPADLSDADALSIYSRILDDMVAGYRLSGEPTAAAYRSWRLYNKAPYRSQTHGERFINNYANPAAAAYGRFEGDAFFFMAALSAAGLLLALVLRRIAPPGTGRE